LTFCPELLVRPPEPSVVVVASVLKRMYCFKAVASRVWPCRAASFGTKTVIRGVLEREVSMLAWLRAAENAVPFVCASVVGRSPKRVKKLCCY
jgi:hypothetical protein